MSDLVRVRKDGAEFNVGRAYAAAHSLTVLDKEPTHTRDGQVRPPSRVASEDDAKSYAKWKKADLEAEVARRNEARDEDDQVVVEGKGTVADLAVALEGDDAAQSHQITEES